MKSQKLGSRSAAVLVAAMAVSGTAMVEKARAAIIIDIQQVGADVVATFSGWWNATGGSSFGSTPVYSAMFGGDGPPGTSNGVTATQLEPFSANVPVQIFDLTGTSGYWGLSAVTQGLAPNTGSVNIDFLSVNSYGDGTGYVLVSDSYTPGSAITGSLTWAGRTMAFLGLDNYGTFTYASGGDSITVNLIGTPSAIPGAGLASVASVGLAGLSRRRRR